MPLITLVLLPFIGSLLAAFLPANARNTESTLAGIIALACAIQVGMLFPEVADGAVLRQEVEWLPALGLNLVIRMDGFAWMFSMLVFGIGALVVLYARYYMSPADPVPRFSLSFWHSWGHGRGGALGQHHPAGVFLGADQSLFLPADWLLVPPQGCTPGCTHGPDGDGHRGWPCWWACWCWAISWAAMTSTMCWLPVSKCVTAACTWWRWY